MRELPTGTVTLLFSDIEGSTRLLQELGRERYVRALSEERRLLRESFIRHGGVEVEMQGDSFHFAFAHARDAVAAAAEAQRALAAHQWEAEPIRVRIGVHTGEPIAHEGLYAGLDVHRAARVMSAGHGGQVLLSQATRDLLDSSFKVVDLGLHRLKDLSELQRLYQVGGEQFPPLKTLHQTNLPVPATLFLGRERELAEVLGLLRSSRLLTLTGPGGTGKTRLAAQAAAEVADEFPGGIWWVSLAALRDPALVLDSISQVLGAKGELAEHIADKDLLLLLDNLEQLLAAAPELAALLERCSGLKLLVTSREPLHVAAEQEYPVPPFISEEAVGFFSARARAARPDFHPDEAVAEVCRRLDNLPLALELAAARVKVLEPKQILARLERALPLLTGGRRDAPERQHTLEATIAWSFDLLAEREQGLFARLAVFAGGFTLAAAEQVCDADLETLAALVDKSLLRQSEGRFWMLETIREYALERFEESGEAVELRRRHADFFLALGREAEAGERADQSRWWDRLEAEHNNLRAVLDWARLRGQAGLELELGACLWRFWFQRGYLAEGFERLQGALARGAAEPRLQRARAFRAAGALASRQGDETLARLLGEQALELFESLGDRAGMARAASDLGVTVGRAGDAQLARALFERSRTLASQAGDRRYIGIATTNLADLGLIHGDYVESILFSEESAQIHRQLGDDSGLAGALFNLALAAFWLGNIPRALSALVESLRAYRELHDSDAGDGLELAAAIEASRGHFEHAARILGASEALMERTGDSLSGAELRLHGETVGCLRGRLEESQFAELWVQGRALGFDQAVRFALHRMELVQAAPKAERSPFE